MKIDYQETTSDLLSRINIHDQYGTNDIDEWMLDLLPLEKNMQILDVACGAGKQCFSFYEELDGKADITGVDVSEYLLKQAESEKDKKGYQDVQFRFMDFNKKFDLKDNQFDLVSCCFAIYYAEDIPFTIREMHRVLNPGGKLFTTGPMPDNKQTFYDIIKEATGKLIPPMPGSSRYASEILDAIEDTFDHVEVEIFENPLVFNEAEPFIEYTRASLSEDRKLWKDFFTGEDGFKTIMDKISVIAEKRIDEKGKIVMTKVVGGFIGNK